MFQLLTGSYRELEKAFLDDLLDRRKDNSLSSLLVLSPSGHLLNHLQSKLGTLQKGFLNTHFLTFYALADRLLADAQYTEQVVTEPGVYHELIRNILSGETTEAVDLEIRKALHMEGKPIPQGLAGALAATLKDLRDAGMRADYALHAAQEGFLGTEAPEAAPTLALYGRLVGLFEKYNLRSSADLLRRAATRAPHHPWIQQQKAIFLYGFYDLTGVQLDLVLSLASHPNAHIYYPYEEGNPAFQYAEKLLNDPAFTAKIGKKSKSETQNPKPPDVRRSDRQSGGSEISLFSCSGARDEVWLAAKEILHLTDGGIPFREIALISRNLTTYLPALREIFKSHQIPYVCSRNEPAGSHPLVKAIRTLLALDDRDPNSKTIRRDLEKSPYVHGASLPRGRETMGTWSAHIQEAEQQIKNLIRLPAEATEEEKTLLDAVLATLQELSILDTFEVSISYQHFLDTWEEKLAPLERPGPAQTHDGIQVLEVQEARGLPFRVVFLLGMNEKVFPRLIREDPFLSDAARSRLAQATGARLGRKLDGYEEERLLFEITRQAAEDSLYLFTQRSDEEGKALIPSVYLKEMERQEVRPPGQAGVKPKRLARSLLDKFENRPPITWTPKEISFLINRSQLDPQVIYKALGWDTASYYRLLAAHRDMETFKPGLGPYDGQVKELVQLKGALAKPFSPSSLEDLAQCPFQYYAGHVLRVAAKEELAPGGELTPMALGTLFHRTLELFYTVCRDRGTPKDEAQRSQYLQEAVSACFQELAEPISGVYPLAIKSSKSIIYEELSSFIKCDTEETVEAGYRPAWFEQPLEGRLPLSSLSHLFYGKPDRLDIRENAGNTQIRVVDYKSGKPKPWTGRIETHIIQGKFLQLPIYLGLAAAFAEKALGRPTTASEATLRPVRQTEEEVAEKTLTADFWKSAAAPLLADNLKEMIGLVENGTFYIEPDTGDWGYCARCDFARICRKEHMPTRFRAQHDPARLRVSGKLARTAPRNEPAEKGKSKTRPAHVS